MVVLTVVRAVGTLRRTRLVGTSRAWPHSPQKNLQFPLSSISRVLVGGTGPDRTRGRSELKRVNALGWPTLPAAWHRTFDRVPDYQVRGYDPYPSGITGSAGVVMVHETWEPLHTPLMASLCRRPVDRLTGLGAVTGAGLLQANRRSSVAWSRTLLKS